MKTIQMSIDERLLKSAREHIEPQRPHTDFTRIDRQFGERRAEIPSFTRCAWPIGGKITN